MIVANLRRVVNTMRTRLVTSAKAGFLGPLVSMTLFKRDNTMLNCLSLG